MKCEHINKPLQLRTIPSNVVIHRPTHSYEHGYHCCQPITKRNEWKRERDTKVQYKFFKDLTNDSLQKWLTLITTSQNRRCFRIVLSDCRKDTFNVSSLNLRKPQSSIASSVKRKIRMSAKMNDRPTSGFCWNLSFCWKLKCCRDNNTWVVIGLCAFQLSQWKSIIFFCRDSN